tara:strand:+ start:137 stop:742 length:606 start_codon:yes stop_codon:yes gene_type:complete
MKKIFKKFFSKDRINLILENLSNKDLHVLEIGIHKGDFSKQLAKQLRPKKLILVDPWIAYDDDIYAKSWYGNSSKSNQSIQDKYFLDIRKYFENEIKIGTVEIHRKTSDNFFNKNQNMFDLIYIDGNHLFDFVKRDIINSLKFIKQDGIIVLDDYNVVGWWDDGITKAVDFFKKKKLIKIIRKHNLFDYHHQCIIKKNYEF